MFLLTTGSPAGSVATSYWGNISQKRLNVSMNISKTPHSYTKQASYEYGIDKYVPSTVILTHFVILRSREPFQSSQLV